MTRQGKELRDYYRFQGQHQGNFEEELKKLLKIPGTQPLPEKIDQIHIQTALLSVMRNANKHGRIGSGQPDKTVKTQALVDLLKFLASQYGATLTTVNTISATLKKEGRLDDSFTYP